MTASRVRGGALIAALIFAFGLLVAPPARPFLRAAARHLGLLSTPSAAQPGRPFGRFDVTSLDGSTASIAPRPGRALVVNIFTTWCTPCIEETPALSSAADKLQRDDIDVVGIDQAESGAQVARFVEAYRLRYPVFIDGDASSRYLLGARVIPTTLLIDRHGVVRFIHVGPLDIPELVAMAKTAD